MLPGAADAIIVEVKKEEIMKKVAFIISILFSANSLGAPITLAANAEITRVANTGSGSGDDFYVYVSGGTGICQNRGIVFPKSLAPSENFHNRAFSIALSAYATSNKKVLITGFDGEDCLKAKMIEIQK